ncbi:RelA/SpoT domain-containing protein [Pyxidicoccus xibeiensis]|uniref:RelA/SpoT domain-containing protein n=1 Tax=Pyxidicoccus xibeiensis TaxID=2906759 RepID=UPI0020A76FD8|nr:RelA/SpoT domain-containing protein [Pyxidicoccus xibeiensis]MCP3136226.1 RelA/SpoT domain-containing protein [Pyxidicoccus xibeiensis]
MFLAPVLEKVQGLVTHHFPWDGPKPAAWEAQLAHVRRWLTQETVIYRAVATALIARMDPILANLQQQLPPHEQGRLFYRLDDRHVLKTPDSILEKMARRWVDTRHPPPISFSNLDELSDLGRFRIVTNFLSDVELICGHLEAPYDATKREALSPPQQLLWREFSLQGNRFEDLISIEPRSRKSGERCRKAQFTPKAFAHRGCRVEVQILTVLQEAWDKKDHVLIYERRRAGLRVDERHEQLSYSLSEQLYLADYLFDQLKQASAPPEARDGVIP